MLEKFYQPFHKLIENSGGIDRSQVAQATEIGIDPKTGKTIFARIGRFGPMLQLGDAKNPDGTDKPFRIVLDGHGLSWQQIQSTNTDILEIFGTKIARYNR